MQATKDRNYTSCAHCLTSFSLLERNNERNNQEVSVFRVTYDNTTLLRHILRTKQNN